MFRLVERQVQFEIPEAMSSLPEIVTSLDKNEQSHLGRLVLLLQAFDRGEEERPAVEGITKLAKLDFLLRYPTYFEAAMVARRVNPQRIPIEPWERSTVEARMVRYRYGPWDHRYRRFLNVLAAKGLVSIQTTGRTINLALTDRGRTYAARIAADPAFQPFVNRAAMLRQNIDIGATDIMKFIYRTFPEIGTLSFDETIDP
jgi:hypothetical protein